MFRLSLSHLQALMIIPYKECTMYALWDPQCSLSVVNNNENMHVTVLKVALHVRVNFRESYREHLATTFRRESKSWLVGSLRLLLTTPELRDLSEYKVSVYTREWLVVREQEHGGGHVS